MLIKDKQSNFEKEMYGFFYTPNIFHLGQVNKKLTLNKIDFYFLKLTEMYFILFSQIKKTQSKIKNMYM